jgi:hypothetical protein
MVTGSFYHGVGLLRVKLFVRNDYNESLSVLAKGSDITH